MQVDRLSLSPSKGLPASGTTFFEKKKTAIGQSKNPRTVSLEEKNSCRNMGQENSGEVDKRWASFTIFSIAKCMNKAGPWSRCPVSNPDPNNTIGLFNYTAAQPHCSSIILWLSHTTTQSRCDSISLRLNHNVTQSQCDSITMRLNHNATQSDCDSIGLRLNRTATHSLCTSIALQLNHTATQWQLQWFS